MSNWIWVWIDTTWIDWSINLGIKSVLVVFGALLLSKLLKRRSPKLRYKKWKIVLLVLFCFETCEKQYNS